MGFCFTIHRNTETTTDMKLKLSSIGSKTMNFVIPPSPDKEQLKSRNFDWSNTIAIGITDEAFFDSKAFLDSDSEQDFYSVNGDFTPSRGNTPIHNTLGTPCHNKSPFVNRIEGSMDVPIPEKKERKKLIDFFKESINDYDMKEAKPTTQDVLGTPISSTNSVWSSERTTSMDSVSTRETSMESVKSARCCLPIPGSFFCRSFRERRRKVKSCNSSQ